MNKFAELIIKIGAEFGKNILLLALGVIVSIYLFFLGATALAFYLDPHRAAALCLAHPWNSLALAIPPLILIVVGLLLAWFKWVWPHIITRRDPVYRLLRKEIKAGKAFIRAQRKYRKALEATRIARKHQAAAK